MSWCLFIFTRQRTRRETQLRTAGPLVRCAHVGSLLWTQRRSHPNSPFGNNRQPAACASPVLVTFITWLQLRWPGSLHKRQRDQHQTKPRMILNEKAFSLVLFLFRRIALLFGDAQNFNALQVLVCHASFFFNAIKGPEPETGPARNTPANKTRQGCP